MGKPIIKAARDRDLYIEWSSIVEAPTFIGTRAETVAYLARSQEVGDAPEVRLQRADDTGTSALRDPMSTYSGVLDGEWGDSGLIYQQMGVLPRDKFAAFADLLMADDEDAAVKLLEPFESDEVSGDDRSAG